MVRLLGVSVIVCSILTGPSVASNARVESSRPPTAQVQEQDAPIGAFHTPPVDAPISDPFRPPAEAWLPGNRGLEYDTTPGQIVRASSGGVVTFAGQVGGQLFVTVRHSVDLRTTVGFVDEILVTVGDRVVQGQPIATAGESIHFTARRNGTYIDPQLLFGRIRVIVRLVSAPK